MHRCANLDFGGVLYGACDGNPAWPCLGAEMIDGGIFNHFGRPPLFLFAGTSITSAAKGGRNDCAITVRVAYSTYNLVFLT
jgi:hypothetical protein